MQKKLCLGVKYPDQQVFQNEGQILVYLKSHWMDNHIMLANNRIHINIDLVNLVWDIYIYILNHLTWQDASVSYPLFVWHNEPCNESSTFFSRAAKCHGRRLFISYEQYLNTSALKTLRCIRGKLLLWPLTRLVPC